MAAAPNTEQIVQQFLTLFYQLYDKDAESRGNLYQLYDESALLKYEGHDITTRASIAEKYRSLPFQVVQHEVSTFDHFLIGDAILISVLGQLKADQDTVFSFSETFLIKYFQETNSPQIYVHNFRLNLHSS